MTSAKDAAESPTRIEPARPEESSEAIADVIAELFSVSAVLGTRLHPVTVANLSGVVRQMNCYYSNLIEGLTTRPKDIERALAGDLDGDEERRNLQVVAAAHVRVQKEIDRLATEDRLPEPASRGFIRWLHAEFYRDAPEATLMVKSDRTEFRMSPGEWRSSPEHDVAVGRHIPPSSLTMESFMAHFEWRYRFKGMGPATRVLAMAAAHHRLNYIHPFPDRNGRVSRLMSHAMALNAGIGAHGLWSVSRGLARGLKSRKEYKMRMDHADTPRQGDLDGRGNLSQRALVDFTLWFLNVCLDQVTFMAELFDLINLDHSLTRYVERSDSLRPEAARLLKEALIHGQIKRGDASRITGLPERTARRVLGSIVDEGLLASGTPKSPVFLRFPVDVLERLFPRLYPET